jgi:hypothetical protein
MDLALGMIRRAQEQALQQYAQELAAFNEAMAAHKAKGKAAGVPPTPPIAARFICSDTTVEGLAILLMNAPRGLLCERDEWSGWIQGQNQYKAKGGSDEAHWLTMHRAGNLLVDRKTGEPKTVYVPRALLCLTGGIQPAILKAVLKPQHFQSGMLARVLMAHPPTKPKRWTEATVRQATRDAAADAIRGLLALPLGGTPEDPAPIDLPLDSQAKKIWAAFYNEHAQEQSELCGDLAAAWSKLEGYGARLALVVHCVRQVCEGAPDNCVDEISIRAGIDLCRWFCNEARRVYAVLSEDSYTAELRELVEHIRQRGGRITARDVTRSNRRYSTDGARAALDAMAGWGWGKWIYPKPSAKGGQPAAVFELADSTPIKEPLTQADTDTTPAGGGENGGSGTVGIVGNENHGGSVGMDDVREVGEI